MGSAAPDKNHVSPFRRLIGILRPEGADIVVVSLFSLIVGILSLAMPVTVEALVNTVAFGRYLQPLFILALMLFTFLAFAAVLKALQTYIAEIIQQRIFVRVVALLAERLPRVHPEAFARNHGPELLNRFFEVTTVQKSAAYLVLDGIAIVITAFIGMVVLAFYHPYLLGFDLLLLGAVLFAVFVLGHGAVGSAIDESYKKYAVASWLQQIALYPTTFKAGGGLPQSLEKADELAVSYLEARRAHFRVLFRQVAFTLALQAVAATCLLGIGGFLVINGQLTLGQLVAAELIVAVIIGSVAKLGKHLESFYDLLAACDKVGHLLDLPTERTEGIAPALSPTGAQVKLHCIQLSLSGNRKTSDITMLIEPGERVALTGPAGSGKSSLLKLFYALQEPVQGYAEYDSMDLRSVSPSRLREQVALVNGIEIVDGTIATNVHLHREHVGYQQIRDSLEAVGLWDEIMALDGGLETQLTLGGGGLSDSQAIRLMLARAIAGRPRLVLVDSIIDRLSEPYLRQAFDALSPKDRSSTVILVTSRDSLLAFCDRTIPIVTAPETVTVNGHEKPESTPVIPQFNLISI